MEIRNEYKIGQIVFLITDPDQLERMVVAITVTHKNVLHYSLACGTEESSHHEFEISETKRVI